jgi:deoxyribonuclease IV
MTSTMSSISRENSSRASARMQKNLRAMNTGASLRNRLGVVAFGPAGLGSVKDAISNLKTYHQLGLKACEIAFTYGIYIKEKEDAIKIGEKAKEFEIKLSIHAPYYINLNSSDIKKVEESKKRILDCCKIGTLIGAHKVIFHAGFYGKTDRKESYENIKKRIIELQEIIKKEGYTPKLAPEIMGKVNVFGSIEEISNLVRETGCSFCIDFAHILARYKSYRIKETLNEFKDEKELHIHFSGIEYGEKGEKNHKKTPEKELKKLISELPKNKQITLINESPFPVEDSVLGLAFYRR